MSSVAKFQPGQIVEHLRFGYRGVIIDVDATFSLSDEWYETVAKSRPPKDQPWYHVLVDNALHATYVAERHLVLSNDMSQIDHPELGRFFCRFAHGRYYSSEGPGH